MMVRFRHGRSSTLGTCRPRLWTSDGLGMSDDAHNQDDVAHCKSLEAWLISQQHDFLKYSYTRQIYTLCHF
jgi:hypothetical protein